MSHYKAIYMSTAFHFSLDLNIIKFYLREELHLFYKQNQLAV